MANHKLAHDRRGRNIPWDENPEILDRMRRGEELRARGKWAPEVARELGIALKTFYDDQTRLRELMTRGAVNAREEHLQNLRELWAITREKLDSGPVVVDMVAPNGKEYTREVEDRAALLAQLRQIEMDMAKLDGSLVERKEVAASESLLDFVKGALAD